jgi:hypothetical protein
VDAVVVWVKLLKLGRNVDRSGTGTGGDALALHRQRRHGVQEAKMKSGQVIKMSWKGKGFVCGAIGSIGRKRVARLGSRDPGTQAFSAVFPEIVHKRAHRNNSERWNAASRASVARSYYANLMTRG